MKYCLLVSLCLALVGCGGEERIAELTSQVASLKSERDKLAAERAAMMNNIQIIPLDPILEGGKRTLGEVYPHSKEPGFTLARASIARVNELAEVYAATETGDLTAKVVAPLYTLESAWPHRMSENGMRIKDPFWWCRDAAVVTRLQMEAMLNQQNEIAASLFNVAKVARGNCHVALAAATQAERERTVTKPTSDPLGEPVTPPGNDPVVL